jgi:hypothetical protein
MRRPVLALVLAVVAAVALGLVMTMGGRTAASHSHDPGQPPLSAPPSAATGAPATGVVPAAESGTEHAEHPTNSVPAAQVELSPPVVDSSGPAMAQVPPDGDPAGQRQISLGEAAGTPQVVQPVAASQVPPVSDWIEPEASGVNEGTKKQAASVQLQPAPIVAPEEVLPTSGQISGCVAGYGRGAVCLPQTPPSHAGHGGLTGDMSGFWTCAELRSLLPDGIVVDTPESDGLGLDGNGDGTACGAGD